MYGRRDIALLGSRAVATSAPLAPWGSWGTLLHSHNVLLAQDDVTAKCCNGGSETGHRRAQGNAEKTCVLGACTPACAEVFLGMVEQCPDVGATVMQTPDWVAFAETCHAVADPPPPPIVDGRWISVAGHYLAADPGMAHSGDTDGTGATAWGIWRTDPGNNGVLFRDIPTLEGTGFSPSAYTNHWKFKPEEWWVEEHGMIMPAPEHLPAGKYKVVWLNRQRYPSHRLPEGGVVLTVTHDRWTLSDGATLHDGKT